MSPLNDRMWVGSKLYTVLAQYGTIMSLDHATILFFLIFTSKVSDQEYKNYSIKEHDLSLLSFFMFLLK